MRLTLLSIVGVLACAYPPVSVAQTPDSTRVDSTAVWSRNTRSWFTTMSPPVHDTLPWVCPQAWTCTPPPTPPPPPPTPPPPPPATACVRTVAVSTVAALQSAVAGALPGDCITLAPGTYSLVYSLTLNKSGTAALPITIQGQGSNTIIDGNGVQIYVQASYLKLRKIRFTDLGVQGLWLQGVTYSLFDSLEVDHTKQVAFAFKDASHHNTVQYSYFHDTGTSISYYGEAMYIGNSGMSMPLQNTNTDNQILYNRSGPNVRSQFLDIKEGSDRTLIKGNTIDGTGTIWDAAHGSGSLIDTYGVGTTIDSNTIAKGSPNAVKFYGPGGGTVSRNKVDLQNVNGAPAGTFWAFNKTGSGQVIVKCNNVVTNGVMSNVACTP